MGVIRYILALMVATYHSGKLINGYHHGIIAVVAFILISGYVMTLLIEKYYQENFKYFYLDRGARLLPQFLFYSILVLLLIIFTPLGSSKVTWLEYSTCKNWQLALNFSIFGNNFYRQFKECMLAPQSWSLGLEAFFYLMIPFILVAISCRSRLIIIVLSFAIFLFGYFGFIDFDLWGYRYLPGTLFIFLVGSSIASPHKYPRNLPLIIFLVTLILYIYLFIDKTIYNSRDTKEVIFGILIGIPLLIMVKKISKNFIDHFFGDLSYGVYLNHVLLLWFMEINNIKFTNFNIFIMLLIASILSFITFTLIEKPTISARHKWRSK
jgi:peptidoglycan/LPS O-acetylase OafA/YrhL